MEAIFNGFYKNPENCIDLIEKARWGDNGPTCTDCGSTRYSSIDERYYCKDCKKVYRVTIGTFLENSKLPLHKWFLAIILVQEDAKITAAQLVEKLAINIKTAETIKDKIVQARQTEPEFLAELYAAIKAEIATAKDGPAVLKAEFGSAKTPLKVGDLEIPCYVLNNKQRVLTGRGMQKLLGFGGRHIYSQKMVIFLTNQKFKSNKEQLPEYSDLMDTLKQKSIPFKAPSSGVREFFGYEATLLVDIAYLLLDAQKLGILEGEQQLGYAERAAIIIRAVAKTGIVSLVDEATGYQEFREKTALQQLLSKYLREEFGKWSKRFPLKFYQEIFRLNGWRTIADDEKLKEKPSIVGRYTNDIVYARLLPGLLDKLKEANPTTEKGNRKYCHHQFLTEDAGHKALKKHLHDLLLLMKGAVNWEGFMESLNRAIPIQNTEYAIKLNLKSRRLPPGQLKMFN